MAANFTIEFATSLNTQGLMSGVQSIMQTISKAPPITVGANVRKVDTGDAQKVLTSISQQAKSLDEVIVKQQTYRSISGETYTALTSMTTKFTDKLGQTRTQTDYLTNGIKNLGSAFSKVRDETVKVDIGKQIGQFEAYYKKQEQAFDAMGKKGAEWSTRAEKMGANEKKAIQDSVALLNQKIGLYKQLVSTGQIAEADKMANAIRAQNVVVEENIAKSKRAAGAVRNWADNIKNAIIQTVSYTFSLGTLRVAQQLLNQAIEFAIELNKEMTKIQLLQVEGAQTDEEINSLAQSYNELAKELGATTLEVAKGSVEWLRQGKTIAETTELLRASTMLSKLGNMDAAESTEYLTSAVNGYGLAAEEAAGIVDKLIAVDNVAATSAKELATALRYSSAVASQAGVPLEKLISYIGVISSTTRQNAEMIGQALKTIFTRMQDIKQGGLDEDGLGINNVERALRRVDIQLRDSKTSFRSMSDVLEDLASKWDTLNEVEQANISKAMAGVRQQNMFMILMTNMNKALELQEVQYNSNGLAVNRYGIYLKSVEASQNRLKASSEALFMSLKDFDNVIMGVNNLASSFLELITDMGGLKTVLTLVTVAVIAYTTRTITASTITKFFASSSIMSAVKSMWAYITTLFTAGTASEVLSLATFELGMALKALFLTNPIGWIALLIGGIIALGNAIDSPIEKLEKLKDKLQDIQNEISGFANKAKDIRSLTAEYEKLNQISHKSTEESDRFTEVQNKLKELLPELTGYYNEYGNFIGISSENLKKLNEETLKHIALQKEELRLEAERNSAKGASSLVSIKSKMESNVPQSLAEGGLVKSPEQKAKEAKEYQEALALEIERFALMGTEAQHAYIAAFEKTQPELAKIFQKIRDDIARPIGEAGTIERMTAQASAYLKDHPIEGARVEISDQGLLSFVQSLQNKLEKFNDIKEQMASGDVTGITTEDLNQLGLEIENIGGKWQFTNKTLQEFNGELDIDIDAIRDLNPELANQIELLRAKTDIEKEETYALSDLLSAQQMLTDALDEQNRTGQISYDTALQMIDAGYASALVFNQETGTITINIQALRQAQLAKAALAVTTAQAAWQQAIFAKETASVIAMLHGEYQAALLAQGALKALGGMPMPSAVSGGGGGGGGESAEKKAIEAKIKALEDEKDALKERLDAFKDYIDAQKESLRLAKEEADFNKEQAKKNKDLADFRTEIAMLALDDSQEARNRRLELEGDAAELEEEITEDSEDRKYDLQIEALDKAQEAFEKVIEAQMEAIDESIEGYREQADAIKSASGGVGGLTSATQLYKQIATDAYNKIISDLNKQRSLTISQKEYIQDVITKMHEQGATADELIAKWEYLMGLIGNWGTTSPGGVWQGNDAGTGIIAMHTGGLVESHHDGEFAGNLKSNEVFSKLLKGELISTEAQMDNFMKNTLPRIAGMSTVENKKFSVGDTSIKIDINIAGSVAKNDLPALKETVLGGVNKALKDRGIKRLAGSFSI